MLNSVKIQIIELDKLTKCIPMYDLDPQPCVEYMESLMDEAQNFHGLHSEFSILLNKVGENMDEKFVLVTPIEEMTTMSGEGTSANISYYDAEYSY